MSTKSDRRRRNLERLHASLQERSNFEKWKTTTLARIDEEAPMKKHEGETKINDTLRNPSKIVEKNDGEYCNPRYLKNIIEEAINEADENSEWVN